ncbi:MAG TPA: disulfide bond formation protein B [Acidimicrobiia bacterium]|nr:disulfide bond formation protein B [Acidimicrobiia bacterium]
MPGFEFATNFFLVLTLVADVLVAAALVLALACTVSRRARAVWVAVARAVGVQALLVAWVVALATTAGSLYYSEHLGFLPCELCWYQRIAMYPLTVVLGVGWFRRDRNVWITALPFVVIGAPLSLYHWLVERVPSFAESSSCSISAPCSAPYFEKLGFVTLAWMCLSSFLLIGTLLALFVTARGDEWSAPTVAATDARARTVVPEEISP